MYSGFVKSHLENKKFRKLSPEGQKEIMETLKIFRTSSLYVNGEFNWNTAIVYTVLKERFDTLDKPKGYFTYTLKEMKEKTTFSEYLQRSSIKRLIDAGLIDLEVREPKRRYFKLLY